MKGLESLKSKILNFFTIFSKGNNKNDSSSDVKKKYRIPHLIAPSFSNFSKK